MPFIRKVQANIKFFKATLLTFFIPLFLLFGPNGLQADDNPIRPNNNDFLNVFLDFPYHSQFIRESLTFVNYVRDREIAHVHIMMTRHQSASAGENYMISFIGRDYFEGMNNKIIYWSPATNTADETRNGLVEMISMGLVPYLAGTNMAHQVSVSINGNMPLKRIPLEDPWNNWFFEVYGGANFFKESTQGRFNARWGFSADKITDEWKITFRPYFNVNQRDFITNEEVITSRSHRHGFTGNLIRSIDQHWSTGLFVRMLSSTFHNMRFNVEITPGLEYSLLPYSEASRKAITFVYRLGFSHNDYLEKTIYRKEQEALVKQALDISAMFQQPWGSFRASFTASNYFHDFNANRADILARLNLRVFKGLSLNVSADFNLINDLLSIPAGELSLEDILLQQRRQATSYQMSGSIGLAYSFGSQFNNVVNTRF
jgi:hypothetical protein